MGILIGTGVFARRGYLDLRRMEVQNEDLRVKIERAIQEKRGLEGRIKRLNSDQFEQQRVVRQVLGYLRKDETMVEF